MSMPYPVELYDGCPCFTCLGFIGNQWKMPLCPTCGNKRCAGANHHSRHPDPSEVSL